VKNFCGNKSSSENGLTSNLRNGTPLTRWFIQNVHVESNLLKS
jgi:hypothetical protein